MLKHIVMFKLKGPAEQRQALSRQFADALMALPAVIGPLEAMETGVNCNPAESYDVVLTATVSSPDLLEAYARHPAHLAAVEIIKPHIEARACVDYVVG